ncbi:uncharacterized protein LOC143572648 [Bidens hawaiensis]|uniref:uncharacterized protein LOC143572648 n=1 Tax=Bidens hawaiensis TaxID=980011 RepID=UPI00404B8961
MAEAIDFSNTHRVLLLIDLQSQNPNPNYINSILTTSKLLLSFNSLSSSLFSFNFLFSSNSIPFNSPEHTLESLSNALRSIRSNKPTSSPVNCAQLARFLIQLGNAYEWKSEPEKCSDVNKDLDGCRGRFRDCFGDVSDVFNGKDIQFCWIDVCSGVGEREVSESEEACGFVKDEIGRFGWGFCLADLIVLGSALVPFGLMYQNIAVSCKLLDCCGLDKRIHGELVLEVLDVSGKPLQCKCCDLELLHLKKHTEYAYLEEFSSEFVLVKSAESGKKGKDGLNNMFTDKVFELLGKHCVPTWQIFLSFLYKEGYWALLSLSNSNRDSYMGILKPFTVNSAMLSLADNNHILVQNSCKTNNAGDVDPQKGVFPFERTRMKKHAYRELHSKGRIPF